MDTAVRASAEVPSVPVQDRFAISRAGVAVALAMPLAYGGGLAIGIPGAPALLLALPAWLAMAGSVRAGHGNRAVADMLLWAAALAAVCTIAPLAWPEAADAAVWNGVEYRQEMWRWLRTGVGAEGSPRLFLPLHLRDLAIFCGAAVVSGGLLAMVFGAALMCYMGLYVASLVAHSSQPWLVGVVGWHPWSVARVAGFVIAGVLLSSPLLRRSTFARGKWRAPAVWAGALVLVDVTLKSLLAGTWRSLLERLVSP